MSRTIKEIIKKPQLLFMTFGHRGFLNWVDDETYLKIAFRISLGRRLNLENPKTYSEKLQWLKLHYRKSDLTAWVDKYEAKELAKQLIGEKYIIPTIGVWNRFDEIDFNKLPTQFVLKCTHDSGGIIICKEKNKFDKVKARTKLNKCLKHNFYWGLREWPYKDISPKIIAEPYMEDVKTKELRDYKFFCFDGDVKALFIATNRGKKEETKFDFFDASFHHLPLKNGHPNADVIPERPKKFEEMKEIASILSKGFPEVRVDLYECNGDVFFGELTFFHWSGLMPYDPEEWDYRFGEWLKLPQMIDHD